MRVYHEMLTNVIYAVEGFNRGRSCGPQWLERETRQLRFESSCCCVKTWAISFSPRCLSSLNCINEYLAIDSGGCTWLT